MSDTDRGPGRFVLLGLFAVLFLGGGFYLMPDGAERGQDGFADRVEAAVQQEPEREQEKESHDDWLRPRASDSEVKTHGTAQRLLVERLDQIADPRPGGSRDATGLTWILGVVITPPGKEWKGSLYLRRVRQEREIVDHCSFVSGRPFRLLAQSRGPFQIRAELSGSSLSAVLKENFRVSGSTLDLGNLALSPGRTVKGRVLSPGGQSLAGALVNMELRAEVGELPNDEESGPRSGSVETNRRGEFMLKWIPPGDYWIVVKKTGFPPTKVFFSVRREPRRLRKVVVRMKHGWLFSGVVQDSRGKALSGARIRVETIANDPAWTGTVSDADGQFLVQASARQLRVRIEKEGYLANSTINVIPSSLPQVFRLAPGATLKGSVDWGMNKPGSPVTVRLVPLANSGGVFGLEQKTDAKGHFEFRGVEEGSYTVYAIHEALGVCESRIRVPEQNEVSLQFKRATQVVFEVVTERGFPLSGAKIEIIQVHGRAMRAQLSEMRSESNHLELDYQGRLIFPTSLGSTLHWTIQDPETHQVQSGSVSTQAREVHRIRFLRYGRLFGRLDLRALTDRDPKESFGIWLVGEDSYLRSFIACVAAGAGHYTFRSNEIAKGFYRFRLVLMGGPDREGITLAESKETLYIRAGRDNQIQCRVAEKQD